MRNSGASLRSSRFSGTTRFSHIPPPRPADSLRMSQTEKQFPSSSVPKLPYPPREGLKQDSRTRELYPATDGEDHTHEYMDQDDQNIDNKFKRRDIFFNENVNSSNTNQNHHSLISVEKNVHNSPPKYSQ